MIQNQLRLIPLDTIIVERVDRQRSSLTEESVVELAASIAQHGLLQNIGVQKEDNKIIWGERRFTAFQLIQKVVAGESSVEFPVTDPTMYDGWTKIPARFCANTNLFASGALEFIENAAREQLPWQDQARAAWELHRLAVASAKERSEAWSERQTADTLGISPSVLNRLITPFRLLETTSPKLRPQIEAAIKASPSAASANNAVASIKERHGEPLAVRRTPLIQPKAPPPPEPTPELEPERTIGERLLRNTSFLEWAPAYSGQPFNFLHCDLPYGINYNQSVGQGTNAATRQAGQYDDSPEVYWDLLGCLLQNRERILSPSAHLLFWFSQNLRRETEDTIMASWPDAVISKFLLIWHIDNNSGLLPTPAEGRRTYETAFQITLGGRPLARQKAMSFAAPRGGDKIHRSEKPVAVLSHFLSMYIDTSSRVLDPTCGSGSSIITATQLKAESCLGLEIDPEMHEQAVRYVNRSLA